jgi:hypothetical protein
MITAVPLLTNLLILCWCSSVFSERFQGYVTVAIWVKLLRVNIGSRQVCPRKIEMSFGATHVFWLLKN